MPLITTEDLRAALPGEAQLCLFLDYDGTLAPIVDQPELAFISNECRATLQSVAATCPVALVRPRAHACTNPRSRAIYSSPCELMRSVSIRLRCVLSMLRRRALCLAGVRTFE